MTEDSGGCTAEFFNDFKDGQKRRRIPWGSEDHYALRLQYRQTEDKSRFSHWTGGIPESEDAVIAGVKEFMGETCPDCNVQLGEFHHEGCDREECPSCHLQAFGCDCIAE